MTNDPVLSALLASRIPVADNLAQIDEMIDSRKRYLNKQPANGTSGLISPIPPKHTPKDSDKSSTSLTPPVRTSSDGIMKATQDTALEMLLGGKPHVRTGEVVTATTAKGHKYPPKDPSKYAYSYLKSCTRLENFKLDEEKNISAWRLKRVAV